MCKLQFNNPVDTREGRIERAIHILQDRSGQTINVKIGFLQGKMPSEELMEALDRANGGVVSNQACEGCP